MSIISNSTLSFLPTPKDYGAKGDGVTNDTTAIINWLAAISGKAGYVPPGTYMCNNLGTIPASTTIHGFEAWFKKNSNGDLASLADRVEIYGLKVHGDGGNYTGNGFVISTGNDQKLYDVEMLYNAGYNLAIAKDVGLRFSWKGGQSVSYGAITNCSIRLGYGASSQESNGDRSFIGLFAGGTWLIDVSYSQTTIISSCDFVNMIFHANASKTLVNGNRIATLGNDLTIDGTQCNVSGNIIAGGISIANAAQYNVIDGNTLTTGSTITDNSGNTLNTYSKSYTYTPTWSSNGTPPAIGNGSITAVYNKEGKQVSGYIYIQTGSTTTYGSANSWYFTLPTVAGNVSYIGGTAVAFNSGVNIYTGTLLGFSTTALSIYSNNISVGWQLAQPGAWGGAGSSWIRIYFNYSE